MDDLSFLAGHRLVLLVVPLALLVGYLVLQRARRRYAVRFTNVDLLDAVAPDRPGWRRHVPALALLAGLGLGVLAVARPAVASERAVEDSLVVLALDTSLSMQATDVTPSRLEAAKEAAGSFLSAIPEGMRVGVVAFDSTAKVALAPTDRLDAVQRTIDRLRLGQGTAIGEAIFTSLDVVTEAYEADEDDDSAEREGPEPATIIVLSDGETTEGRPDSEAVAAAKAAGIAVQTIAFGTDNGTVTTPDGQTIPVPVNREALASIASETGGRTFDARSAEQLQAVFEALGEGVIREPVTRELGDVVTLAALALVSLAAAGSLLWFSRLP
jgi:Ca-activated chloride channel family protein